jgi:hypothetical protein
VVSIGLGIGLGNICGKNRLGLGKFCGKYRLGLGNIFGKHRLGLGLGNICGKYGDSGCSGSEEEVHSVKSLPHIDGCQTLLKITAQLRLWLS